MTSNLENFNKAKQFLTDFDNFILLTHKNLDIDALGSLLGLALVLENYGKSTIPVSFDKIPPYFSFLPGIYKVIDKLPNSLSQENLPIILLDCAQFNRTGFEEKLPVNLPTLIIDHHPSFSERTREIARKCHYDSLPDGKNEVIPKNGLNKRLSARGGSASGMTSLPSLPRACRGARNDKKGVLGRSYSFSSGLIEIVNSKKSSTAEILFDLIGFLKLNITPQIATCLLAGIIGDTGGFRHSNTTSGVMEIAARLVAKGARVDKISRQIFSNTPLATLKIIGRALERIETDPSSGMALSLISEDDLKECGATTNDLSGIANILANVDEAKFTLFLAEYEKNRIKGSLRSEKFKGVDVAKIAHLFGGGGHKFASGFEIAGNLKESVKNITERITRHLNI